MGPHNPYRWPSHWMIPQKFSENVLFWRRRGLWCYTYPNKNQNNEMQNFLKIFTFPWNLIEPWNYHNPCSYQGEMFDFKSERCGQPFCSAFFRNPLGNKASDKRGYNLVLSEGRGILIWHLAIIFPLFFTFLLYFYFNKQINIIKMIAHSIFFPLLGNG